VKKRYEEEKEGDDDDVHSKRHYFL